MARRTPAVREPIQVYLDPDERRVLDDLAEGTGLSRAEILRRGLKRFAAEHGGESQMLAFADSLKKMKAPADAAERHDWHLGDAALDPHD